jgi:anti-sigma-K factor RskA
MSSEIEEIGEYVLRILEKMKETESRIKKLEDSVNSISKVIEEAAEEAQTEDSAPNAAPSISIRLWAPLNAVKWIGVFLAAFFVANIRARMSIVAWSGAPLPNDFPFWNMIDGAIASVSLAVAAAIEIFLFWKERRRRRPSTIATEVMESEEAKEAEKAQAQETEESLEASAETEEAVTENEEAGGRSKK